MLLPCSILGERERERESADRFCGRKDWTANAFYPSYFISTCILQKQPLDSVFYDLYSVAGSSLKVKSLCISHVNVCVCVCCYLVIWYFWLAFGGFHEVTQMAVALSSQSEHQDNKVVACGSINAWFPSALSPFNTKWLRPSHSAWCHVLPVEGKALIEACIVFNITTISLTAKI